MYQLLEVFCIDFEASSLSANGYPIEVGIADAAAGQVNSWLIRPTQSWSMGGHWDDRAEAVHGIARDRIERDGLPVPDVIEAINNLGLTGGTVLSDCPRRDNKWLEDLYRAGGYSGPPFVIGDLEAFAATFAQQCGILSDAAMLRALEEATVAFPDSHRAGIDARRGVELLRRLQEAGASLADSPTGGN